MSNPLVPAIEAAAESLKSFLPWWWRKRAARIAVEAAAPFFYGEMVQAAEGELKWQIRADRAEAEVERLAGLIFQEYQPIVERERALADQLAEALLQCVLWAADEEAVMGHVAIAAWREARNGTAQD